MPRLKTIALISHESVNPDNLDRMHRCAIFQTQIFSFRWMHCWMVKPGAKHCRKDVFFHHVRMQMKKDSCNVKWRACEGKTVFTCRPQMLSLLSGIFLALAPSRLQKTPHNHPACQHSSSHMSLSMGGGWVMLHISTRDPSFSWRLGL